MRTARPQGFTLFQLAFFGLLIGLGGLAAFKVGKPYADVSVVRGTAEKVLAEVKGEPTVTEGDIAKKIFDRCNVQSIYLEYEGIKVKAKNSAEFTVHIDMTTKMPLWKKAYLLLDLSADAETK